MENESAAPAASKANWKTAQLLAVCAVCLMIGVLVGYLVRGSAPQPAVATAMQPGAVNAQPEATVPTGPQAQQAMPSLDDMRRMADKKAEPLLAKLKSDPKNPELLNQIGLVYKSAHQFKEAAGYFEQSLRNDPKNIGVRADYASCLYFTGDVDGALAQLNKSLTYDPTHAGTLMNIGIIKWKSKNDAKGAIESWEKVLKYHPDFPQREMVEHMITEAKQSSRATPKG
jgi:cytochrome c-type biogenesis protein CcmH/NrfG